jgi:hypothetical protein
MKAERLMRFFFSFQASKSFCIWWRECSTRADKHVELRQAPNVEWNLGVVAQWVRTARLSAKSDREKSTSIAVTRLFIGNLRVARFLRAHEERTAEGACQALLANSGSPVARIASTRDSRASISDAI